jgi:hypothetical protein
MFCTLTYIFQCLPLFCTVSCLHWELDEPEFLGSTPEIEILSHLCFKVLSFQVLKSSILIYNIIHGCPIEPKREIFARPAELGMEARDPIIQRLYNAWIRC